jgi:Delta3,5-Delta2,4-dienoyl-CoA isomerase
VHGVTFGLALDALSAVDVRWAATDASFSIKEVDVGLAADLGTLARMPKLIGNTSLLYELALEGRTFGADEASRLGIVSRVVDGSREEVVSAAIAFAKVVAGKSPVAVVGVKRFLAHALDHSCVRVLSPPATGKVYVC